MEKSYFFDSTLEDQRIYQAADFAKFHSQIIGNGVSNTSDLPDLEVTAKTNMAVSLGAGYMFANGYMYENSTTKELVHEIADSTNDRIDRIVICFDNTPAERRIYSYIKKGVAAVNPTAPELQRDNYIYELSVAQIRIIAGKSYIEQSQIKDERPNDNVCGYIPLHNIYRGLTVNELGMVSMLNQSFIKAVNIASQQMPMNTTLANAIKIKFGEVAADKQGEIINADQFIPKADGIYSFWLELAFLPADVPVNGQIIIYVFVNGKESFPLGEKIFSNTIDRYMMCSGFDDLKKGDTVDFRFSTTNFSKNSKTEFTRVRVAKMA